MYSKSQLIDGMLLSYSGIIIVASCHLAMLRKGGGKIYRYARGLQDMYRILRPMCDRSAFHAVVNDWEAGLCFKSLGWSVPPVTVRNPAIVLAVADPAFLIPRASSGYSSFGLRWAASLEFCTSIGYSQSTPGRCICSPPPRPTALGLRRSPAGRILIAPKWLG